MQFKVNTASLGTIVTHSEVALTCHDYCTDVMSRYVYMFGIDTAVGELVESMNLALFVSIWQSLTLSKPVFVLTRLSPSLSSVAVGQLDMTDSQLVENIEAAVGKVADNLPGGIPNISSVRLTLQGVESLPLFMSLGMYRLPTPTLLHLHA